MENQKLILTGEKESFVIRVLMNKLKDAGTECEFVPFTINDLNAKLDHNCLVTLYMEHHARPDERILHFLNDKMVETGGHLMPVGERAELQYISGRISNDLIYKSFERPVNNDEYIKTVKDVMHKVSTGEFKKSILIVDDDPNYLGLVREWLKGTYKVSMANSGLQALKWLGKNKADLILLDYEMPVTSGPQVLEMLRSDEETKNIPVMFLTGKGDKESVMEVLALKPEGYYLKNISMQALLSNLEEFFALRGK